MSAVVLLHANGTQSTRPAHNLSPMHHHTHMHTQQNTTLRIQIQMPQYTLCYNKHCVGKKHRHQILTCVSLEEEGGSATWHSALVAHVSSWWVLRQEVVVVAAAAAVGCQTAVPSAATQSSTRAAGRPGACVCMAQAGGKARKPHTCRCMHAQAQQKVG
jgi:hypothetical protein